MTHVGNILRRFWWIGSFFIPFACAAAIVLAWVSGLIHAPDIRGPLPQAFLLGQRFRLDVRRGWQITRHYRSPGTMEAALRWYASANSGGWLVPSGATSGCTLAYFADKSDRRPVMVLPTVRTQKIIVCQSGPDVRVESVTWYLLPWNVP